MKVLPSLFSLHPSFQFLANIEFFGFLLSLFSFVSIFSFIYLHFLFTVLKT